MPAETKETIDLALTAMGPGITDVIIQDGIATGDIPHVLAALTNHPERGVIVVDTKVLTGLQRVANVMVDNFQIAPARVKYVNLPGQSLNYGKNGTKKKVGERDFRLYPLTKSTKFFINELSKDHFKLVKKMLRGDTLKTASIEELSEDDIEHRSYLESLGINFEYDTVVLWGRESGRATIEANKPLDAGSRLNPQHPQYDHSYTGMQQIVKQCQELDCQIIVAGDYREKESAPRLYIKEHTQVIGKYWNVKQEYQDRKKQVRLFYVLKKILKANDCNLVHVGMRSGGLDTFGFSGQKAIYIALPAADLRMKAVVDAFAASDMGTQFQRFAPQRLPKRGTHDGQKNGRTEEERGFSPEDLQKLKAQIKAALGRVDPE